MFTAHQHHSHSLARFHSLLLYLSFLCCHLFPPISLHHLLFLCHYHYRRFSYSTRPQSSWPSSTSSAPRHLSTLKTTKTTMPPTETLTPKTKTLIFSSTRVTLIASNNFLLKIKRLIFSRTMLVVVIAMVDPPAAATVDVVAITTTNFSKRMAICLKTLISSSTARDVDVDVVDVDVATTATATTPTTATALATASLARVSYISCYGFLLESISCVLFTNFTSLCHYQHIVFPYCSLKVHLPDLLDLPDDMVVMIHVNSAALTTVPIVAIPAAMIHALGAILINQEGGWAFDEGESVMWRDG